MGGADVIEGKSHISLFAAYKGVNHVRGIAFDIQGKTVQGYELPVKRRQIIVQKAVHCGNGQEGGIAHSPYLVRFIPKGQHLGRDMGKGKSPGCGQGGLDSLSALKKRVAQLFLHGSQPRSGSGW